MYSLLELFDVLWLLCLKYCFTRRVTFDIFPARPDQMRSDQVTDHSHMVPVDFWLTRMMQRYHLACHNDRRDLPDEPTLCQLAFTADMRDL